MTEYTTVIRELKSIRLYVLVGPVVILSVSPPKSKALFDTYVVFRMTNIPINVLFVD